MDFGLHLGVSGEELGNPTATVVREGHNNELVESSDQGEIHQGENDIVSQSSSGRTLAGSEGNANLEPQVGMEFESETAVHAFYSAYAMRTGFIARSNKVYRSRRDRAIIGREYVCNKEGFRVPDKRRSVIKPRAPTRLGCKAMIAVKRLSSGKWTISRFVKEHSHPLTPGKNQKGSLLDQYPVSLFLL
ncbi:protein FAR1-RELATED SEQUENCE 5-like [Macadamia integrifolia]|uniref:protein FAR1-RELATED SEQUENCE 5-like n=1 Tax=Macadamia integrifolia TaxID=60698 RepID=UPI001C501C0A|nr:protein FAR1-RELATED SEQUENCE 5-like [Macadamia integrifolia]